MLCCVICARWCLLLVACLFCLVGVVHGSLCVVACWFACVVCYCLRVALRLPYGVRGSCCIVVSLVGLLLDVFRLLLLVVRCFVFVVCCRVLLVGCLMFMV